MSICQQTVSNWLGKGAALLQNLLPCLKRLLLKAKSVLNIDETWCRVRIANDEFQHGKYFKKYFWVVVNTALNYMINGWEKLLNYRHDGRYDIDNLEAERNIRPLIIGRKNTLFFGSEEGVEVATTYYTLIETAKLNNLSPMDYLTHVFRQLMEGNKDYESLLPGKLALQAI